MTDGENIGLPFLNEISTMRFKSNEGDVRPHENPNSSKEVTELHELWAD